MVSDDWAWTGATDRLNAAIAKVFEVVVLDIFKILE
jgi:hypothetical protein